MMVAITIYLSNLIQYVHIEGTMHILKLSKRERRIMFAHGYCKMALNHL